MPVQQPDSAEAWARLDDVLLRLLSAVRSGDIEPGRRFGEGDLVQLVAAPAARVRAAIDQLVAIGLFAAADDRTFVVTAPTLEDWANSVRFLTGLAEMTTRRSIPTLDDADVRTFDALVARARQQAALRDIGFTETLLNVHKFFAERVPDPGLLHVVRTTIRRLAWMLTPTPPFRQWAMDDYFALISDAVADRDVELGVEASHVLLRHAEAHIDAVRAEYASMG